MTGFVSSFEGTEKKFELVVDPSLASFRDRGARFWAGICDRAGAAILSRISNRCCDAYLLSESSLFVFDHRIVMMTCGRTTLPEAVLGLLEIVPADRVRVLAYERKNEIFPHAQPTSFFEDVRVLNDRLPGRAYRFGDGNDHHLNLFHLDRGSEVDVRATTFEVLMWGLDDRARDAFCRARHPTTREVRRATAIDRVLAGFDVDDHLFSPTGYSLNAIRDAEYYAVHVTPEQPVSYASFETNHVFDGDMDAVIDRLLETFRPRSYDLVLFDRSDQACRPAGGYCLKSHVARRLGRGSLQFMSFYRPTDRVEPAIELSLPGAPAEVVRL
jgi:S-adenosylmethionine decarboxylase